ncbi:MAG TPA: serine hydrolase [Patescibacteria group bacterium]|nr:serine hydrolase [Patescibacteria group bacterium]
MAKPDQRYQQYYSSVQAGHQSPAPKRHAKKRWLLVLLAVGFLIYYLGWRPHAHSAPTRATTKIAAVKPAITAAQMDSQIQAIIRANPDVDISASIIDINSGTSYQYGINNPFEAASVGKLITATTFLHLVETSQVSLNDQIGDSSAQNLLEQMIVNSDNDAWQALSDDIGLPAMSDFATQVGMSSYNADGNTMTSNDIALLLQKLYKGSLLNHSHTQLLLGYMNHANEADYIPSSIPAGIKVYHKAGLLDDRVHDAAIVDNGLRPYVLVIFTNGHGTYDLTVRTQILRDITTSTTKFFLS